MMLTDAVTVSTQKRSPHLSRKLVFSFLMNETGCWGNYRMTCMPSTRRSVDEEVGAG